MPATSQLLSGRCTSVDAQNHGFEYKLEFNDWLQYLGPKVKAFRRRTRLAQLRRWACRRSNRFGGAAPIRGAGVRQHRRSPGRTSRSAGHRSWKKRITSTTSSPANPSISSSTTRSSGDPFLLVTSVSSSRTIRSCPPGVSRTSSLPTQMKLPDTWGKVDLEHMPKRSAQRHRNLPLDAGVERGRRGPASASPPITATLRRWTIAPGKWLDALRSPRPRPQHHRRLYLRPRRECLATSAYGTSFSSTRAPAASPLSVLLSRAHTPGECATLRSASSRSQQRSRTFCGVTNHQRRPTGQSFARTGIHEPASRTRTPAPSSPNTISAHPTPKYMVRDGDLKYVVLGERYRRALQSARRSLPSCNNLARLPEHQARAQELKQKLFAWHKPAELQGA